MKYVFVVILLYGMLRFIGGMFARNGTEMIIGISTVAGVFGLLIGNSEHIQALMIAGAVLLGIGIVLPFISKKKPVTVTADRPTKAVENTAVNVQAKSIGRVKAGIGANTAIVAVDVNPKAYPMGIAGIEENGRSRFLVSYDSYKKRVGSAKDASQFVKEYQVLTATEKTSAVSAVSRAAVGSALVGPAGLAAGLSAKKKQQYTIQVTWMDGNTSVIELNGEGYEIFLTCQ